MMYGFGDDLEPLNETKELMEQYLIEYIANLSKRVLARSMRGGHDCMQTGDAIFILRDNAKTYYRIPHSLEISKIINRKKIDKSTDMKMSQLTNNFQRFN